MLAKNSNILIPFTGFTYRRILSTLNPDRFAIWFEWSELNTVDVILISNSWQTIFRAVRNSSPIKNTLYLPYKWNRSRILIDTILFENTSKCSYNNPKIFSIFLYFWHLLWKYWNCSNEFRMLQLCVGFYRLCYMLTIIIHEMFTFTFYEFFAQTPTSTAILCSQQRPKICNIL